MKFRMAVFVTILLVLFGKGNVQAQCNNKISVSSTVKNLATVGTISVDVNSMDPYKCTLVIATAVGDTFIDEKEGDGNTILKFTDLKIDVLYSVRVVFSKQEKFLCNQLSKTILLK